MKYAVSVHALSPSKQIAFAALFAALCCVGTAIVQIPAPQGGFLNVGDVFVLLAGWCLGPLYGSVAAAVGSALADVVVGFPVYAPATFLIKGMDAFVAYTVWSFLKKAIRKEKFDALVRAVGAIAAECVMVVGYAVYDGLLAGFGAAVANTPFNILQGVVCAVGAVAIVILLARSKSVREFFPRLQR